VPRSRRWQKTVQSISGRDTGVHAVSRKPESDRLLVAQGDLPAPLSSIATGPDSQVLVKSDARNDQWQRDLSLSYDRLGAALFSQGDLSGALASAAMAWRSRRL